MRDVRPWWPHTHGDPTLYPVEIRADGEQLAQRRAGFRSLDSAPDLEADGLDLHVNGVPVFCRGAVWTPLSLADPHGDPDALRAVLCRAAAAGPEHDPDPRDRLL